VAGAELTLRACLSSLYLFSEKLRSDCESVSRVRRFTLGLCPGSGTRTSDARNENAGGITVSNLCAITREAHAPARSTLAGGNAIAQPFQPNAGNANG
jgi:hypothetical protein